MSFAAFHRSGGPAVAPPLASNRSSSSPPVRSMSDSTTLRTTSNVSPPQDALQPHLDAIHHELEELKRRRERLEAQRRALLEGRRDGGAPKGGYAPYRSCSASTRAAGTRSHSTPGLTAALQHSDADSRATFSTGPAAHRTSPLAADGTAIVLTSAKAIPSELERRRQLKATPHLAVKNALRAAAQQDSVLVMGGFLPEDNPRACTFGRERRFRQLLGQNGRYYLSTEVAVEQYLNRDSGCTSSTLLSARRLDSQTPGPGAYTPRYTKVSRLAHPY
ncbi:hypothetical protein NESM_000520800 [Novymonas esmeraldas]|uniref:Uncharacterized protein n=1 Tax=Novymonas esmeraldas TaxID=1808958 RepID=A0AAW0ERL1_9TRYP